jgi:membrane-bound serine protease (ClpP class)
VRRHPISQTRWPLFLMLLGVGFALLRLLAPAIAATPRVTVIDLHGAVWPGMASFVIRQIDDAWKSGASGIILDIDTTRGSEDAAQSIKSVVVSRSRDLPIAAYVHDRALGPGALVALACKTLAMSPGASLGGASNGGVAADFRSTADALGRNPEIAVAFVSADAPLPALGIKPTDSLTLTTKQAQSVGYCDVVAVDYPDVLAKMGLGSASLTSVHLDTWTSIALWVSQPWATIVLLGLGLALVIVEVMTWHSWGLAGLTGGALVLLIFAAHITVGTATWVGVVLFLAGVALMVFEAHLPGHGLAVLGGLVLVFVGMYYALGGAQTGALYSAAAALLTTIALIVAFFIYLPRSPVWKKIGQPMRQSAAAGYVSSEDYTGFLGHIGTAATLLRPSGTAEIQGIRLAVVSEGEFIPAGTSIQVVLVQGSRIVVRAAG